MHDDQPMTTVDDLGELLGNEVYDATERWKTATDAVVVADLNPRNVDEFRRVAAITAEILEGAAHFFRQRSEAGLLRDLDEPPTS